MSEITSIGKKLDLTDDQVIGRDFSKHEDLDKDIPEPKERNENGPWKLWGELKPSASKLSEKRLYVMEGFPYGLFADSPDWQFQHIEVNNNREVRTFFGELKFIKGIANSLKVEIFFFPHIIGKNRQSWALSGGEVRELLSYLGKATNTAVLNGSGIKEDGSTYFVFDGIYANNTSDKGYFALYIEPISNQENIMMLVKIPGKTSRDETTDKLCQDAFDLIVNVRDVTSDFHPDIEILDKFSNKFSEEDARKIVELLKKYGRRPIIAAIENGDYESASFLLDHIQDHTNYLQSVFVYAFMAKQKNLSNTQIDLIIKLFNMGKYNVQDSFGFGGSSSGPFRKNIDHTLLSFALHFDLNDLFYSFLEAGVDINARKGCLLTNAVETGDVEKVRFVLDNGAKASVPDGWTLQNLVQNQWNYEMIELLLTSGANFDKDHLMYNAIIRIDIKTINLLLSTKYDPNSSQFDFLAHAVQTGNTELVKFFLDRGLKIKGAHILKMAIDKFDCKMVEFLIKNGANPRDTASPSGTIRILDYALSLATKNSQDVLNKDEILRILVMSGALDD